MLAFYHVFVVHRVVGLACTEAASTKAGEQVKPYAAPAAGATMLWSLGNIDLTNREISEISISQTARSWTLRWSVRQIGCCLAVTATQTLLTNRKNITMQVLGSMPRALLVQVHCSAAVAAGTPCPDVELHLSVSAPKLQGCHLLGGGSVALVEKQR